MENVQKLALPSGASFRGVVKKAEDFQNNRVFLLRMAKICVTEKLTVIHLAKAGKRVYNIKCIRIIRQGGRAAP